uniref:MADF domain-containing protein n=1 Tax=Caenorhabditis tropicalis TaxID=1561998 RepID=A0A1I7T256_9PELO
MDQWGHQNQASSSMGLSPHSNMGHVVPQQKEVVQYIMRQVSDSVRLALCQAIAHRPLLWDCTREKCSSSSRKRLFGEVVDEINAQFVLDPPISIEEVEKHWKNLKDTYVKTRRKLTYDQNGCIIRPKWKFYEPLMFLDNINHDFAMKKRPMPMPFPGQPYDIYPVPQMKKDKLDDIPTDEYMEFCRSMYLPLKEIGYKDRVHWLKIQKTIRDIIFEAQMETVTKTPPDMQ